MALWFTADLHLDHEAILRHNPPRQACFETLAQMNDAIVDGINACVARRDTLIVAGDVFWRRPGHFRQRLNVRQLWVAQGNHDSASLKQHVSRLELMIFVKKPVRLHIVHYPLASWRWREHAGVHLHGHTHNRLAGIPGRVDVGVDAVYARTGEWRPASLEEVLAWAGQSPPAADDTGIVVA